MGAQLARAAAALALVAAAACGQKGPPLAPLRLVPAPVTELSARRQADTVRLRFVLPTTNSNGPGAVDLDRVEIYAMTVPAGTTPANRDLLSAAHLVGRMAVRPAAAEGAPEPPAGEARPGPGETVTFEEVLTPAVLVPAATTPAAAPLPAVPGSAQAGVAGLDPDPSAQPAFPADDPAPPSAAAPPVPGPPVRVYAVRGITRSGRPGPPSSRVQVPMAPVPPPPGDLTARYTETAIVLEWKPASDAAPQAFNVYRAADPALPLNPAPLPAATFETAGVQFGEEQCYRVRSVEVAGEVSVEGEPSPVVCVTPRDEFPPSPPRGLAAVPTPGQISLIWDASPEKDVAGYLVLRGQAGDERLQAITPAPIRETSFRDTTVTPGTRYVYSVVAVDAGSPPNMSAQSERREETAR